MQPFALLVRRLRDEDETPKLEAKSLLRGPLRQAATGNCRSIGFTPRHRAPVTLFCLVFGEFLETGHAGHVAVSWLLGLASRSVHFWNGFEASMLHEET